MNNDKILEALTIPGLNIEASLEPREIDLLCNGVQELLAANAQAPVEATSDGALAINFNLTKEKLPSLSYFSSSYGGQWNSKYCIVLTNKGTVSTARLTVREEVKAQIDKGLSPNVRWPDDFYEGQFVAWAYVEDVEKALTGQKSAALSAAPAQPTVVPVAVDTCTELNCSRCLTHPLLRTPAMRHAGIGSYPFGYPASAPAAPQEPV